MGPASGNRTYCTGNALLYCSGLATGLYSTNSPDACWYVADSAECDIIIVDSDKQLQKILTVRERLPRLKAIVQYSEPLRQKHDDIYTVSVKLHLRDERTNEQTKGRVSSSVRPSVRLFVRSFVSVRSVCQGSPSYGEAKKRTAMLYTNIRVE